MLVALAGIAKPTLSVAGRVLVPALELKQLHWLDLVPQRVLDRETINNVRAALFPSIVFTGSSDAGRRMKVPKIAPNCGLC